MDENKKKQAPNRTRNLILGVVALVLLIGVMLFAWISNRQQAVEGSKAITIQVVDDQGATTTYNLKTDAEYLRQAIFEVEGLTVEGDDGPYGLYVKVVNGLKAVYEEDGAFWSFYVNGELCMEGADTQPVYDGDTFVIQYELAE